MPTRPCPGAGDVACPRGALVPARPGSKQAPRCPVCQARHDRARNTRRPGGRTSAEARRRHDLVAAHVQAHGYVCPGCPPSAWQPHPADPQRNPLSANHVAAVGAGGSEHGPLEVMCLRGNSSLGARPRP